jgi:hypothetical protein
MKQIIAKIDGKNIHSEEEMLQTLCNKLPFMNYVELDGITSVEVLQECLGMIEEYKYHIDDMIYNIKDRIDEIEYETDEDDEECNDSV